MTPAEERKMLKLLEKIADNLLWIFLMLAIISGILLAK